jgi:hypothetical protein
MNPTAVTAMPLRRKCHNSEGEYSTPAIKSGMDVSGTVKLTLLFFCCPLFAVILAGTQRAISIHRLPQMLILIPAGVRISIGCTNFPIAVSLSVNFPTRNPTSGIDWGGIENLVPPLYGERFELALDRLEADWLPWVHAFQGFLVFHDNCPVHNHM